MATSSERANQAWELLKQLVRIDNTNPPGNEKPACELLARRLAPFKPRLIEKEAGRTNLVCRQAAGGGGLLLAGHLDTVPAGEGWSRPPFSAAEADGYLYGRGTLDMKHLVAMFAVVFEEASRRKLKKDLTIAFLADEEVGGGLGSSFLVEEHAELVRAEAMLGEGGGFYQYFGGVPYFPIGRAEKGQSIIRIRVDGAGGHGSIPDPGHAAFKLARLLEALRPGRAPLVATEPARLFLSSLAGVVGGAKGAAVRALCRPLAARAALAALPPSLASSLRSLLTDTASPTRFSGSDAVNVVPREILVDLDVRTLPGSSASSFLSGLWKRLGEELECDVLETSPAVVSRADGPVFEHLARTVLKHAPDCRPVPFLIPGFTDAKHFSRLGMDCYGFAPLALAPADAAELKSRVHGVDERVAREAFFKGYEILEDAVLSYVA